MGFGLLFTGHLFLFFCKGVDIFPDSLAYLLITLALIKLSAYNTGFRRAKLISLPLLAAAVVSDVFQILAAADILPLGLPQRLLMAAVSCGLLVMYWFTLDGVSQIAKEVGRDDIAVKARRNRLLTAAYTLSALLFQTDLDFVRELAMYFGIVFLLLGILWVFFNGTLFYSCYMWICLEGDENMPEKPKKHRLKKNGDGGGADEADKNK